MCPLLTTGFIAVVFALLTSTLLLGGASKVRCATQPDSTEKSPVNTYSLQQLGLCFAPPQTHSHPPFPPPPEDKDNTPTLSRPSPPLFSSCTTSDPTFFLPGHDPPEFCWLFPLRPQIYPQIFLPENPPVTTQLLVPNLCLFYKQRS